MSCQAKPPLRADPHGQEEELNMFRFDVIRGHSEVVDPTQQNWMSQLLVLF